MVTQVDRMKDGGYAKGIKEAVARAVITKVSRLMSVAKPVRVESII